MCAIFFIDSTLLVNEEIIYFCFNFLQNLTEHKMQNAIISFHISLNINVLIQFLCPILHYLFSMHTLWNIRTGSKTYGNEFIIFLFCALYVVMIYLHCIIIIFIVSYITFLNHLPAYVLSSYISHIISLFIPIFYK